MNDLIYKLSKWYKEKKTKFLNLGISKFYKKWLYKPFKFVATAISWSVFVILIICAVFLIYYYLSMKSYSENGAGYEPKYSLYTIISGSMYPTIEVYDVVFVVLVDNPEDIEVGDIISYNSSSFISGETISVTHRVVEIVVDKDNNYTYYTKGDNNLSKDSEGISFSQITGTVEFKIPQLGRLQFFLASEIGWFLIIILPALFIIIKYIVQLINLPKLFGKIPKDSIFFPIFNKPIMLPFKENERFEFKEKIEESYKESKSETKIPINILEAPSFETEKTLTIQNSKFTEINEKGPLINEFIMEKTEDDVVAEVPKLNEAEKIIEPNTEIINKMENNVIDNSNDTSYLNSNKNIDKFINQKQELDINMDDIFNDFKNLSK